LDEERKFGKNFPRNTPTQEEVTRKPNQGRCKNRVLGNKKFVMVSKK
jgi:hypothetical protein